jgi:hypothetical protein
MKYDFGLIRRSPDVKSGDHGIMTGAKREHPVIQAHAHYSLAALLEVGGTAGDKPSSGMLPSRQRLT